MITDTPTGGPGLAAVLSALDGLFAPWSRTDAPGLLVGIAKDGKALYRRGVGMASLETSVANTPATRMRIGSTSKHFTCLLAQLLAEEGQLDLDAPIRAYLPELSGPGGDPSLRELMQHRGGSRCYLDLGFICHGLSVPSVGAALAAQVRQTGRNFAPGEAMIYNNGGYHLLSIAIERVVGAPFEQQLKSRFFDPLGMTATASIPSDYDITSGIAALHMPLPDGRWRRGIFPSDEVRGEGGIVSTIDDMLRWMAFLRAPAGLNAGDRWEALATLPTYADGSIGAYGLGLMQHDYRGVRTIHHAGSVIGGACQMLTAPDYGLDIIIITNGALGANPVRLAEQVVDIVLADRLGAGPTLPAAGEFQALLGAWWSPDTGLIYSLFDEGGVVRLAIGTLPNPKPLHKAKDGRLVSPGGDMGEIEIMPQASNDRLAVRFGGQTLSFERLVPETATSSAFDGAAGRYFSADANATATLEVDGGEVVLSVTDGYGVQRVPLALLGETIAAPTPTSMAARLGLSVQLLGDAGQVTSLRLNTTRTRNLMFQRLPAGEEQGATS